MYVMMAWVQVALICVCSGDIIKINDGQVNNNKNIHYGNKIIDYIHND